MDVETSATPDPQITLSVDDASDEVGSMSLETANSGSPDGSGTPVTGGWSPPAK